MAQEQQQQSSSSFRAADAIEDVGVPFGVAHQRAQELEKYPSGREGSDEDGSRSPGVRSRVSGPVHEQLVTVLSGYELHISVRLL